MNNNRGDRLLIEYHKVSEETLKVIDALVYNKTGAGCHLFHDTERWNAMVLVTAKNGNTLNRDTFRRGTLYNDLKGLEFNDFSTVAQNRIDNVLNSFLKRPEVRSVTYCEEAEQWIKDAREIYEGQPLA